MKTGNRTATVVITGAAGFIGRRVACRFAQEGYRVVGIDTLAPENAPLADFRRYVRLALPSPKAATVLAEVQPDVCVHCAGRASVGASMAEPAEDFYESPVLTFELLNTLRLRVPTCRFLFVSSAAVYGNPEPLPVAEDRAPDPISPYGYHKLYCEQLCHEFHKLYGIRAAAARIFSAYGAGLRRQVIWDICRKVLTEPRVELLGTGAESRDFIHAIDIARGLDLLAHEAPMEGEVYNLCCGTETSVERLAAMIVEYLGETGNAKRIVFDKTVPPGTPLRWKGDIGKIAALGFQPSISLEHGLRATAAWCRAELCGI